MTRPWIKFHTTALDDVRLLRLNERQQLRYFQMYLLAGRLNADGLFVENNERLNEADIAIKLRVADRKLFTADFNALKKAGLIKVNGHGPYIEAFAREQVDWNKAQEQNRKRQADYKKRHASVTRDQNVTDEKSRVSNASVTPLDQTKTKKKIKTKKKKEIKNQPPTKPSSFPTRRAAGVDGGGQKKKSRSSSSLQSAEWMNTLTPIQRETAQIIAPILTASGLGHSKLVTLLPKVAMRIEPAQAKEYALAALASVYADKDVSNKPVVAAYRMENDQVSPVWTNKNTWQVIPAEVLKAADVQITPTRNTNSNQSAIDKVVSNEISRR